MSQKLTRAFVLSAGGLLLAAALARFFIFVENSPLLHRPDALLGIPLQLGVVLVGGVELGVALACLFGTRTGLQAALLAWASLNYLVFRIGLVWMGVHQEWTCIGSLTDPLHLARGNSGGTTSYVIPSYLLVGSFAALLWPWLRRVFPPASAFAKMSCPGCGGHIKFARHNLGQEIPCPHCKAGIILRKPENLKMSCYFCHGHIEFPSHALGTKMPCPHCRKDITLKEPKELA